MVGVVKNCVIGVSTKKDVCVVSYSYSERTNEVQCNFDVCLQRNDLAEKEVDVSPVIISLDFVFEMYIRVK